MSTQKWRTLIVVVLFGLLAAACGGAATDTATDTATPAPAEEPAAAEQPSLFDGDFVDLNGESIDLASFEGQDVVLWFWAPW